MQEQKNLRSAAFLKQVGRSVGATVQMFNPKSERYLGDRMATAVMVGVPALLAIAAVQGENNAHAQTIDSLSSQVEMLQKQSNPFLDERAADSGAADLQALEDGKPWMVKPIVPEREMAKVLETINHPQYQVVLNCLEKVSQEEGLSPIETAFAAVQLRYNAGIALDEIMKDKNDGMSLEVKVAAFCANPTDWESEVKSWKEKAERASLLAGGHKESATLGKFASESLGSFAAQQASRYNAMQYAADIQSEAMANGFDRSLLHNTSGDWLRAATSIAGGLAQFAGSKEAQRDVRSTSNKARRVQRIANRVERLDRYEGARKWEQIGSIVGEVGRTVDLGQILRQRSK